MSWWVSLSIDGGATCCSVEPFEAGGTYVVGGSGEADLNITYNYSKFYYRTLDSEHGLRALDGQKAKDWIARMELAVEALGTDRSNNYWDSTEGNAGYALNILLSWAKQYPDGIWRVN